MNLNHHTKHIIVQKIRLELVKHFQSDELNELKEQFKKEFIKINNKSFNEKDLEILEKYKCFVNVSELKICKHQTYINYFSGIYNFDKIQFDPEIKMINNDRIPILNHPEIKKLANEIYLVACNIQSDIEKLVKEYYLRIESCKTVEKLLEKFPDMKKFNLLEEIKEKYKKYYGNDSEAKIKTVRDNKKIISKFYATYFKQGEKNERRNSGNKKQKNK